MMTDVLGGVYMPEDGQADPVGVTNVLAKAAKMEGVQIFEKTPVEKILVKNKKIIGVQTKFGKIDCEYVVIATGMWARDKWVKILELVYPYIRMNIFI